MDTVYENAQRRREELRRELEEIDLFLRLHQRFSGGTKAELSTAMGDTNLNDDEIQAVMNRPERRRNLPKHLMAKEVRKIILHRRVPMTRTDIVEALELKGVPVAGQDKPKAIGTIMWRLRDKFRNIEGLGYWPSDVPYPPTPNNLGQHADIFGDLNAVSAATPPERR